MKTALLPSLLLGLSFQAQAMDDLQDKGNPDLSHSSSPSMSFHPDTTQTEPAENVQSSQEEQRIHSSDIIDALKERADSEVKHASKDLKKLEKKSKKKLYKLIKK